MNEEKMEKENVEIKSKQKMEHLRKVIFTERPQNWATFDGVYGKMETEMNGFFHGFGNHPIYDHNAERYIDQTIAIVEEEKTGMVFEVLPQCLQFVTPLQ